MKQKSDDSLVLKAILTQDANNRGLKSLIHDIAGKIQQRTFWYFTEDDASFLNQIYQKQVTRVVLKERIRRITKQKLEDVMAQIVTGQIKKASGDEVGKLQIGVGGLQVSSYYEQLPQKDMRTVKCWQRVKQINQDFKQFKAKMDKIRQRQSQKKAQQQALQQQFKKSLQKQKKQQYHKVIRSNLAKVKQNDESRKLQNDKFKLFLQQYKKTKPLHVLMQEMYHQKVQLPQLQQNKKKLQAMTHRKKPTLQQINEHDNKYISMKQARPQKTFNQNYTIDVPYKSRFYQEEEQRMREKEEQDYGSHWDFLQKQKRYSQFVKDTFKPKMSLQKKRISQQMANAKPAFKQAHDRSKINQLGNGYLQYMRSLQKRKASTPVGQAEPKERYVNYLQQLRSKSDHRQISSMSWQLDLRDRTTSQMQKRDRILRKSKQLQEKAKMDQKFVSNYNYGRPQQIIQKKREIDQVLLSSIKAKVAVLSQAHKSK